MTLKKRLQFVGVCFILFSLGLLYLQSNHELALTQRAMTEVSEGIDKGDKAFPISLKKLSGENIELAEYEDQNIFLFFFTTWCEICSEQWNHLQAAKNEGFMDGTKIIAINLTDEERNVDDVIQYAANVPIDDVTILLDEDGVVQNTYQVAVVPTRLLINKGGIIEDRAYGLMTFNQIKESSFFQ
ncbi:redoxin domain-containing protein [Evansella cellulosilytica]|uniref:Alkyl hydroperoxide reductase/ Thiol specific antioxidant/ Mal allergen n=1 Tax=Evansella cellulosilytica (strain ATCC 21833 / DSM 2522 / FERM P-1141 / JCM 9156 / N-4) TaxID=649639 RepID=E6TX73_EVAC2|nr:redoxin domain-containing protein [Evansella cellulosilytica]ADU31162.1 alkyl hydroperoxide reductase/ Thiol specific antioxidant/ Mal allergen [Evansella cellulosilytica DSM 2522]